ncbi:hypothetical protein EJ07DRAFT_182773 [Lizonia empirigonia]|nr:hypothetical protein EJ07DRAFT_182773 [Lizonia empirigonia]
MARNSKEKSTFTAPSGIPQYIYDHAPIFRLHTEDQYRPASISEFLDHTRPQIERQNTLTLTHNVTLGDLDRFNNLGAKGGTDVYLTSYGDVTKSPRWLDGTPPPYDRAGIDKTGVIILAKKEKGVMDVFYFCFFAFNWGGIVLGHQLGNHVGDWEHAMVHFVDGVPKYVWMSQHANGEAYKFKALEKDASGKRPVLYVAKGSHAIYPKEGAIDHTFPNANSEIPFLLVDYCNKGPRYDPLHSSFMYMYSLPESPLPKTVQRAEVPGYLEPLAPTTLPPGWLYFTGHWGDEAYPDDDPRQKNKDFLGFRRYGDGPTGPAFKGLERDEVWPANSIGGHDARPSASVRQG